MLARLAAVESAVAVHAAQLSDGLTEVEGRLQSLKYEAAFDSKLPGPGSEIPGFVESRLDELDQFEHISTSQSRPLRRVIAW